MKSPRHLFACLVWLVVLMLGSAVSVRAALSWKVVIPSRATNEIVVAAVTNAAAAFVPGAVTDGFTDNTVAFSNAMKTISDNGGGVLYVPAGHYAFYGSLNVPTGVTIHGDWYDWSRDTVGVGGTVFKVYGGRGQTNGAPFIFLNGSTGLRGVTIWYPDQNPSSIVPYPWCIGVYGDCVVQNVGLVNPYYGIQVTTNTGGAKHIFSSVVGTPLATGIEVDGIADISHLEDIRFGPEHWASSRLTNSPATNGPQAAWMRTNGTALRLLRVDGEVCMDTIFSGYKVGIEANKSPNGVPGATFYGGAVSNCGTALLAQDMAGQSGLQFSKFILDGDIAVDRTNTTGDATVQFAYCQITGRKGIAVHSTGLDWHSWMPFQNCTITGALVLDAGAFNVVNSSLTVAPGSNHCILKAGAVRAAFVGCSFNPAMSIANAGSTNKVIIDGRRPLPSPLPNIAWADTKRDYESRKPAKTNLYVVTDVTWGAKGNGTNDDTAAIQSALNAAESNGGGIVFLPGGKYHLTNTLVVSSGVELRGTYEMRHRTWPAPDGHAKGAVLQPYGGQGTTNGPAAIILKSNSGLVGVTISYETQTSNAIPFPPTIAGAGGNVYVIGVVCPNPYTYVDFASYTNNSNHLLYMVDGWALRTGFAVGHGSSGSIVDCHANWTYWWDNYDSPSVLNSAWRVPVLNFCEHNLEMYVLGDCTELLIKDFVIPTHTGFKFITENGRGPNVTAIGAMCDQATYGFELAGAAASNRVDVVNSTMAIFADYPDLTNTTVAVMSRTNFQGAARFFNSAIFGGPYWDAIVGGGDVGMELVHMLDHAYNGARVDAGVFHLINSGAYITYTGPSVFPLYNVSFSTNAGIAGKVSELVGNYSYSGYSVNNTNANNPVLSWSNYQLQTINAFAPTNVSPPQLGVARSGPGLTLSWPGNIGAFNLTTTTNVLPPATWNAATNAQVYSNSQWLVTFPAMTGPRLFGRLQQM